MDVLVLIDKLDDLVHNAKAVPLTDQVRIDREEIYDILDQMRATIPEEIKQARWIVKERQEMLAEAKREQDRLLQEAREQAVREASQTEIVKLAERQAQEIIDEARRSARETRLEMEDWADGILATLESEPRQVPHRGPPRPRAAARALAGGLWPRQRRRSLVLSAASPTVTGRLAGPPAATAAGAGLPWADDELRPPRLKLRPGEEHREALEVELPAFEFGGQRYLPVPEQVPAELSVTRALTGTLFTLAFTARLHGPCYRCLGDAVLELPIRAREYQAASPDDDELRTPYLDGDELEVSDWARDAVVARAARQDPLPARLRRALPGLRREPERPSRTSTTRTRVDPRWAALEVAATTEASASACPPLRLQWRPLRWPSRSGKPRRHGATRAGRRTRSRRRG